MNGDLLPAELARFVEHQVAIGKFNSPEDVLRQGVRLLQERERRIEELQRELKPALDGLDRGEGVELDISGIKARAADRFRANLADG